ncbi:hypothetical protein [Paraclostridium bifermentans]|uniref:hypothetical protein n=1 Tax=Paraclostridium bifermentans TaxID=1490 RepID=UPI001156F131|nr:hypothetical protein [Paraclostridium bifermentans]TQO58120.1 hypothetical protein D5S05_09295 [Paraclostridium bifermentans]
MGKIIFCNVAWMDNYDGNDTKFSNGGEWVKLNNSAGEYKNFYKYEDGYLRGYVKPVNFTIRAENFNESKKIDEVNDVLVIWVSTPPDEAGRRVIGWYKNATVFRKPKEDEYSRCFFIKAKKEDGVLLNTSDRNKSIYIPRSLDVGYGMGQSNTWFAKEEKSKNKIEEVIKFIDYYEEHRCIDPNRKNISRKKEINKINNSMKKTERKKILRRKSKCMGCENNNEGWCKKYKGWCSRVKKSCR